MNITELKNAIETESGVKVTIKKGTGSMLGYTVATARKGTNFAYGFGRDFVKRFKQCDVKPAYANTYQIFIYHV